MASRFSFLSRSACLTAGLSIVAALLVACTSTSAKDDRGTTTVSTWWLRDAGAQRILPVVGGPLMSNAIRAAATGLPERPANVVIVERGGPVSSNDSIFVHGTHGANSLVIGRHKNDQACSNGASNNVCTKGGGLTVRSLKGERLTGGTGCRYDDRERLVRCDDQTHDGYRPINYVYVHLWSGDDIAVADPDAVRPRTKFEVWGGQGNDKLSIEQYRGYAEPLKHHVLLGGDDNDTLIGSVGSEALWGGPGDDYIQPGGGMDNIDGGHGEFDSNGPIVRPYRRDDAFCADRTHGYWDRRSPGGGGEGVDTLNLGNINEGMLADLNICRVAPHHVGDEKAAMVAAMEIAWGTNHNDRIVGDDTGTTVVGNKGEDWLYSGVGGGTADARDEYRDTVRCVAGPGQRNLVDQNDAMLQAEAGVMCTSWEAKVIGDAPLPAPAPAPAP